MGSKDMNILGYVLALFVIGVSLKIYFESDVFNLKCIISDVDGNKYCVRETPKLELVADLLAKVTNKLKKLVEIAYEKYPKRENVKRLKERFNPKKISEILPTSKFTAYSEDKGKKIAFCTTKTKGGNELIDENTLTFVGIHEISHVCSKTVGHNDEFWANFKFLLEQAKEANIHNPIDYKAAPREYCGMKIHDNPYYDA